MKYLKSNFIISSKTPHRKQNVGTPEHITQGEMGFLHKYKILGCTLQVQFEISTGQIRDPVQRKCNNSEDAPISPSFRIAYITRIQLHGCTTLF